MSGASFFQFKLLSGRTEPVSSSAAPSMSATPLHSQVHPVCELLSCTLSCTQHLIYSPASSAPRMSLLPLPPQLYPTYQLLPCALSCTRHVSYSSSPSAASGMSATPCPRVTGKASFLQWMSYCKLVLVSPQCRSFLLL